jgi:hypothetical protein
LQASERQYYPWLPDLKNAEGSCQKKQLSVRKEASFTVGRKYDFVRGIWNIDAALDA